MKQHIQKVDIILCGQWNRQQMLCLTRQERINDIYSVQKGNCI